MNILFINNQGLSGFGGGVTILRNLVNGLATANHITVLSYDMPGLAPANVLQCRIPEVTPAKGPEWRMNALRKAFHNQKVLDVKMIRTADLVICMHSSFALALKPLKLRRLVYISLSCIPRQEWFQSSGIQRLLSFIQYVFLERSMIKIANTAVVSSRYHCKEIRHYELISRFKSVIQYPVFPVSKNEKDDQIDKKVSFSIIVACRLIALKNIEAVLYVARELNGIDCEFTLVGAGPEADRLHQKATSMDLGGKVVFAGASQEMAFYYKMADVLLHPSLYESFGMSIFEGMQYGVVPVCSRKNMAAREFIDEGVSGYFVDFNKPGEVAKLLKELSTNKKKYEAASLAASTKTEEMLEKNYLSGFRGVVKMACNVEI